MQDWDDSIRTNEGEACHHGAVVLAGQDLIAGHHRHIPLILPLARLLRLPLLWRPALLMNPSEVPLYQSPELNLTGEVQKNVTASDKGCFGEHACACHGSLSNKCGTEPFTHAVFHSRALHSTFFQSESRTTHAAIPWPA